MEPRESFGVRILFRDWASLTCLCFGVADKSEADGLPICVQSMRSHTVLPAFAHFSLTDEVCFLSHQRVAYLATRGPRKQKQLIHHGLISTPSA